MPGYVKRAMQRFKHPIPPKQEDAPHSWIKPTYGKQMQYAKVDTSPFLDAGSKKKVQEVIGTLLYYARAVDSTMLVALNSIAAQQSKSTKNTMQEVTKLLNYCASHPNATVTFCARDMVLWCDSNASYLSAPKARSRAARYHYLSNSPSAHQLAAGKGIPMNNGAVHVMCSTLKEVMASAAKAELAGLFHNGKTA